MTTKTRLSVIGGDTRQIYAADRLQKTGFAITLTGFEYYDAVVRPAADVSAEEALRAPVWLLPLPFSRNGETVNAPYAKNAIPFRLLSEGAGPGKTIFLGNADAKQTAALQSTGAAVIDYFRDESLTLYNAMLTAEGLMGMIIDRLPCAVFDSEAAVVGFGRVGFYLARLLHAAGASVTVFARDPAARTKARTLGLNARDVAALETETFRFDYLVNTVPAKLLKREALRRLNTGCRLFEAASAPYGVDSEAAQDMGFTLYKAFSLPGKTSPKSAGSVIAETVRKLLTEVKT